VCPQARGVSLKLTFDDAVELQIGCRSGLVMWRGDNIDVDYLEGGGNDNLFCSWAPEGMGRILRLRGNLNEPVVDDTGDRIVTC